MKGEGGGNEASWNTELKGCSLQGRAVVSGSQLPWVSWADGLLSGPGCWGWAYLVLLGASVQVRCTRGCSDFEVIFFLFLPCPTASFGSSAHVWCWKILKHIISLRTEALETVPTAQSGFCRQQIWQTISMVGKMSLPDFPGALLASECASVRDGFCHTRFSVAS